MGADLIATNLVMAGQLVKIGSVEKTALGGPLLLVADVVNGALEARYSALSQPDAGVGYQVSVGKTLWLTRLRFHADQNTTEFNLISGTADAGNSQLLAPAGVLSLNSRTDGIECALEVLTAHLIYEFDVLIPVLATLFPAVHGLSASSSLFIEAWGFEV